MSEAKYKINITDKVTEGTEYKTPQPTYTFESGEPYSETPSTGDHQTNFSFMADDALSNPKITYNGETFPQSMSTDVSSGISITDDDGLFIEPVAKFNEDGFTPINPPFDWRYGEGSVVDDLTSHMKSTYTSHYTNENDEVQTLDVFAHRGTLGSTSIDNAIKYLMRYGKKEGKNEKDLIKAMHYLVLATAYERKVK